MFVWHMLISLIQTEVIKGNAIKVLFFSFLMNDLNVFTNNFTTNTREA